MLHLEPKFAYNQHSFFTLKFFLFLVRAYVQNLHCCHHIEIVTESISLAHKAGDDFESNSSGGKYTSPSVSFASSFLFNRCGSSVDSRCLCYPCCSFLCPCLHIWLLSRMKHVNEHYLFFTYGLL